MQAHDMPTLSARRTPARLLARRARRARRADGWRTDARGPVNLHGLRPRPVDMRPVVARVSAHETALREAGLGRVTIRQRLARLTEFLLKTAHAHTIPRCTFQHPPHRRPDGTVVRQFAPCGGRLKKRAHGLTCQACGRTETAA